MTQLGPILTAMVTPFDRDLAVDSDAAASLMTFLTENGSDGVVIAGTTGEAPTLTDDEQLSLVALAVDVLAGKGSVVAGAGSNDTRHACYLTERATELGADAILSVTPYYNRPGRRGIIRHFEEVAKATDKPIILYNIPTRTGTDMPNELLAELAQIDGISGVKQARDTDVALIDGLDFYAGNDEMFCDALEMGGAGGILVTSHIAGPEMRRMVDEPSERRSIDAGLKDLYAAVFAVPAPTSIKAAFREMGRELGGVRLPLVDVSEEELAGLRVSLERHNLTATRA